MTQTQTIMENPMNETRIVLRPLSLNLRESFRNVIDRRSENNINELPFINSINRNELIDSETIIEINNSTISERRLELMKNIINNQNNIETQALLIENSPIQVITYLNNLLISSASNLNISEEDLYRIGNIFLYTISNLDINGIFLNDIILSLRESMITYNTNRVFSILSSQVPEYNQYLYDLRLATEDQLNERTQEFYNQLNEKIIINRRRMIYTGLGFIGSLALSSFGLPPIGGLLTRSLIGPFNSITPNILLSENNNIVRLRDIWDLVLLKTLKFIK